MKHKSRWFFAAIFSVLLLLVFLSYFHVDGMEIRPVAALSSSYTATVTKTHASLEHKQTEYTLTGEQVLLLKDLIQGSRFTRKLTSGFAYSGLKDTYRITLELIDEQGKQQDYLSLHCVEGTYLRLWATSPDSEYFQLLIQNPDWHDTLEAILNAGE